MPKKIEVIARTLPYGNKLLGKGGTYTVDDYAAKGFVADGKAKIVQDLGTDMPGDSPDRKIDYDFLGKVKSHLPEIFDMLDQFYKDKVEAERSADRLEEEESKVQDIKTDETGSEVEKTEETTSPDENVSPSSHLGSLPTTESDSSIVSEPLIPEDFPGFTSLNKNGIHTMKMLRDMSYDDLIEAGIKQGTANQIGAKLAELENAK